MSGATTTLTVTATDDQLVEGTENGLSSSLATPTSTASISTAGSGTVNVTDNDTATVTLSGTAAATEGGATGSLTATLTLNTSGTGTPSLQTAITGVTVPSAADYTSSSGSFGVGAVSGATSTLTITAVDDPLVEGPESFPGVTLSAPTSNASVSTAGSGTVNITDNDTATVSVAGTLNGSETGPASATFTVTQSATSSTDTVVAFTLGGTATEGSDYTAITHSVTIPANTTTATITIPVINDAMVESTETVTVTLVSPITSGNAGISVDTTTASRTITDNDSATVSVAGTLNGSETGPTSATFTVTQSRHQFHRYGGGLHAGGHRHRRFRLHRHHAFRHDSRQHHHGYDHDPRDQRRPGRTN